MQCKIHPSIGVARLGSSKGQFCLSPESIGGLPFEADQYGNKQGTIVHFKDDVGQVRRQGQPFKVYQADGSELTLNSANVESIEWTVHLANKKAAWYQYAELKGNLLYGENNSYQSRGVALRNPNVKDDDRRKLIVDPGPRSVSGARQTIGFDKSSVPDGYPATYPSEVVLYGTHVTTLGNLVTDDVGRLIVLGAYGNAGGNAPLTSYGGSDTWHDDIADGPVYCKITFNDGSPAQELQAWVIVGSPDFAPEIVNISTLSDTMFDVGVRYFNLVPEMYINGAFCESFHANYQRDILPIIQRIGRYQWVANVQSMMAFSSNVFDFSDSGDANKANRHHYFSFFRQPDDKQNPSSDQPQQILFKETVGGHFPQMPLNSGSNSVSNDIIEKFLALNETQYFLLNQWANGNFVSDPVFKPYNVDVMDEAGVGNCVGLPMCPGIEVTWSLQNKNIYSAPYVIEDQKGKNGYNQTGLSPSRDECEGDGCEPGDLTKRMACPWQADFFQCTVQYVNFTDPNVNKSEQKVPMPPTYYTYWWPPQSPWDVLTGDLTAEGQAKSHMPAGQQMNYARGINTFVQMVEHWSALAFIRDSNPQDTGFPYFTETERNHEVFAYKDVGVGLISGNPEDNETQIPVFYIEKKKEVIKAKSLRAAKMVEFFEQRAFKPIEVASGGLGMPRSGTRSRR
ncbi:L-lysine 6-oxidase [Nitrosospira sp. Nsp11]|uniref:CTQ-dependent lysine 6-oxidase LodA n=1 Tax=Nitrosospira sp. Nsp11 TaxID=1855338 RepID=UPI000916064B|nr:CTQ-dependent lysine 6-oxidase LodA [Nitrosospira sp. Nsp11]SHL08441.1 L-lysine 6-oxidase [Nitrosospira sp. Nsp11]